MKIHLLSDLHLEFSRGKIVGYREPEEADVFVLAGDIGTGEMGLDWALNTFEKPVVYVMGNHECYGGLVLPDQIKLLKAKAEFTNVFVLENGSVVIEAGGDVVRFLGGTMWTDFDLYRDPYSMNSAAAQMNDYRHILMDEDGTPFKPEEARRRHIETRAFLRQELECGDKTKTVVVTHHAPSEQSVHGRYKGNSLTPAYASNMEDFILDHEIAAWAHGHVHHNSSYEIGNTKVHTNTRGYHGYELNPDFDPHYIFEA